VFNTLFPENHAVYEIMWKNIVQRGRPHITIRRMCCEHARLSVTLYIHCLSCTWYRQWKVWMNLAFVLVTWPLVVQFILLRRRYCGFLKFQII